jgi:hypothetical protein
MADATMNVGELFGGASGMVIALAVGCVIAFAVAFILQIVADRLRG